jgi:hypothetical protein
MYLLSWFNLKRFFALNKNLYATSVFMTLLYWFKCLNQLLRYRIFGFVVANLLSTKAQSSFEQLKTIYLYCVPISLS